MPAQLVSIVIPVYNGANYMRQAIDSALAQTYKHCEIVVVDDGSTDNGATESIARSYEPRIRYVRQNNGGVAAALNRGVEEARGDFITWLAHDDLYAPERVARQLDALKNVPDQDAAVLTLHDAIDEAGGFIENCVYTEYVPDQMAYQLILAQTLVSTLLVKRTILQAFTFDTSLPTTQDYDLLVRLALNYPILIVEEVLYHSRRHGCQGSHSMQHTSEVKKFFCAHIQMLTRTYMHRVFPSSEYIPALERLGKAMAARDYAMAVALTAKQMVLCSIGTQKTVTGILSATRLMLHSLTMFAKKICRNINIKTK